jgi:hypothetical protein
VRLLIACEEVEPISSWPYDYILRDLVDYYSQLDPVRFARLIVRKYIISYKEKQTYVTQSVLDLSQAEQLSTDVQNLVGVIKAADGRFPTLERAVMRARAMSQHYFIEDYVDLYDFCQLLIQECDYEAGNLNEGTRAQTANNIDAACKALMQRIRGTSDRYMSAGAFVPVHGLYGFPVRHSYGVSIYFPCRDRSDAYQDLEFASQSGWGSFLDKYAQKRVALQQAPSTTQEDQPVSVEEGQKILCNTCGDRQMGPVAAVPFIFPSDPVLRRPPGADS